MKKISPVKGCKNDFFKGMNAIAGVLSITVFFVCMNQFVKNALTGAT